MRRLQRTTYPLLALAAALVLPLSASAQTTAAPAAPTSPPAAAPHRAHRAAFGKKLAAEVGLTPQQVAQIKAIRKDASAQAKGIRADKSLTPAARQQKLKALRRSTRSQVEAVLTPEQRAKWEQIRQAQRKAHAKAGAAVVQPSTSAGPQKP